jgi:hypothetical protein
VTERLVIGFLSRLLEPRRLRRRHRARPLRRRALFAVTHWLALFSFLEWLRGWTRRWTAEHEAARARLRRDLGREPDDWEIAKDLHPAEEP